MEQFEQADLIARSGFHPNAPSSGAKSRGTAAGEPFADRDPLTGLMRREAFESRLDDALAQCRQNESLTHVLLKFDLCDLETVAGEYGVDAAELLLVEFTARITQKIRTTDVLARIEPGAFAVLLHGCQVDRAGEITENVRAALGRFRIRFSDQPIEVTVDINPTIVSSAYDSVSRVMSAASRSALAARDRLAAKPVERAEPEPADTESSLNRRRLNWVSMLAHAADQENLELFCQPAVAIGSGDSDDDRRRFELLLRLREQDGTLIAPDAFIPLAERYQMMPQVDQWVLAQAVQVLTERDDLMLSVNIADSTLANPDYLRFLDRTLSKYPLKPGALCFEITENAPMGGLDRVVNFIYRVHAHGCLVALDGFGNGPASLAYLKSLPVDVLKLDGYFFQQIARNDVDRALVSALTQVGRVMGFKTVATRVEARDVFEMLATVGVDFAQGFYLAHPAPLAQIGTFGIS